MKTKFLIAVIGILLIACKGDKEDKAAENQGVVTEVVNPNFNIEVTAISFKKDAFALYFTEDNTINFTPENAIWAEIDPNKETTLKFEIKEERIPSHVRLDFGLNKEQDSVVVKDLKIKYLKKNIIIKGSDFFLYFNEDSQFKTKLDPTKGTLTIVKDGPIYKSPFFYPNENLVNELKGLILNQ